ncbi:respiratory nitrate reductase subunit gamma [Prauserella muralis]|uniref:Nitrate reductase-like protein NarX n=1 Tax=Prauserella muralis TaxID=588067 RepID=A0A2V4AHP1_9PSEU|nr:respiratory nitrate reductase subunit gamma [Prauserella muralis]PXY19389.1 respiratory nitrate reductase subunit gamma [Prauserella muralis]TWE29357.1 respiratory nitrate reductase gamma subunit [Prauserella muralis]
MTADIALWAVLPYVALTVFVVGHVWRWRADQFGWTTRTTQVLENRWLRLGSPLFHLGAFAAIAGHVLGLLVPKSWTEAVGVSEHVYHVVAVGAGTVAGVMVVAGLGLLLARRFVNGRVRRTTTRMDKAMFAVLAVVIALGMAETVGVNLLGPGYDYRETVAVWFRGIFYFQPDASLMSGAPMVYQLHAISAWVFLAMWPFTRLVHVWSAPIAYLWRPYVVYRRRSAARVPETAGR